jgi:hypothetical protein
MKRPLLQTALFTLFSLSAFAQATFTFTSFDPPGSSATAAWGINTYGTIVGSYSAPGGVIYGFERTTKGTYYQPIKLSGENVYINGINTSQVKSGYYSASPLTGYPPNSSVTSFTRSGTTDTDFSVGPDTEIYSLNNKGDLVGIYQENSTTYPAFFYEAATNTTTTFSVPGAEFTFAYGINDPEVIVGASKETESSTTYQGFLRRADGHIATVAFKDAISNIAYNINECNVMVGAFTDAAGATHGFYGKVNALTELDYPGATATWATGINNSSKIGGQYTDAKGVLHGFLAVPTPLNCDL